MKKSIISLIAVIIMLLNSMSAVVFADAVSVNPLSLAEVIAKDMYGGATNVGADVIQNEKYVFVVEGAPVGSFENDDVRLNDKIHIYEKPNNEHIDYKYLTSVYHDSNATARDLPARGVAVLDDVLYVAWGNAVYSKDTHGGYPLGDQLSYAAAYDVSDVEAGETLTVKKIATSLEQRTTTHAPFTRGGILSFDEENGKVYISGVQRENYKRREYYEFDSADVAAYVTGEASSLARKTVLAPTQSMNTTKFTVKDGYLYEILQQKAGLIDFSNDNTLTNADGTAKNNTIVIWDAAAFSEIGAPSTSEATYMTSYKRAEYTTDTAGGVVIKDIAVSGDYMYLATKAGLEVVDVSSAKSATEVVYLTLETRLHEGTEINGLEVIGEKLYAGTDDAMLIYDVSQGVPSLINTYSYEGGFVDFEFSGEENMLYALSAAAKGGAMLIDLDILSGGLNVTDFEFTQNSASVTEISSGTLSYSAAVENKTPEAIEFSAIFVVYKGNKLAHASVEDYYLAAGASDSIEGSLEVSQAEGLSAKVVLLKNGELLPMVTEAGIEFEKELGTLEGSSPSADKVNISDMDEEGNIVVSGTMADYKNKPLLVMAENLSSSSDDERSGYRFIDVVTLDADGAYAAKIKTSDSGDYEIKLSKGIGKGTTAKTLTVPQMTVTMQNSVEVPGIESYLYVEFENGQNIETFDFEMTFDGDVITAGSDVTASNEFAVSDVTTERGKLTATFTKKDDATLTTAKNEFCIVPITVASGAALGDYEVTISAAAQDELSNEIDAACTNGTLSLVESTPKYEALDEAVDALEALKNADEITVDDYISEKAKAEAAREKVNAAYEYFIRDSQMGIDLINNLASAEAKLAEIKPYYDAVDALNAADSENVISVLEENKEYFSIDDEALEVYKSLTDKSAIDSLMLETSFEKPSDVLKVFYEKLILEAFKETGWQNVEQLLDLADDASLIDVSSYDKLTAKQKAAANKELALTEYDSISELDSALEAAVAEAKETVKDKTSGTGGSGSSSNSGRTDEYYVKPADKTEAPADDQAEIFIDISEYGWAKEAIEALYEKGVISGKTDKIFAPGDDVTREEFAKMVSIAFGIKGENNSMSFTDVGENDWYAEYVYVLAEAGIINGRDDGSYGVGDSITRQDIAVILERVALYKGAEIGAEDADIDFTDGDEISGYAVSAINKLCSAEILSGYPDGTVKPQESANRAAAAQLIYMVLLNIQ